MAYWFMAPIVGLFPIAFTVAVIRLVAETISDGVR